MKAIIQRVDSATLSVEGRLISSIDKGLVVYLGVESGDTLDNCQYIANKIVNMRIFADQEGKMNLSIIDKGYQLLLISQFTLLADTNKGNRPSFVRAELPQRANQLYLHTGKLIADSGVEVQYGVFGADMTIQQVNCGPVTIDIERR